MGIRGLWTYLQEKQSTVAVEWKAEVATDASDDASHRPRLLVDGLGFIFHVVQGALRERADAGGLKYLALLGVDYAIVGPALTHALDALTRRGFDVELYMDGSRGSASASSLKAAAAAGAAGATGADRGSLSSTNGVVAKRNAWISRMNEGIADMAAAMAALAGYSSPIGLPWTKPPLMKEEALEALAGMDHVTIVSCDGEADPIMADVMRTAEAAAPGAVAAILGFDTDFAVMAGPIRYLPLPWLNLAAAVADPSLPLEGWLIEPIRVARSLGLGDSVDALIEVAIVLGDDFSSHFVHRYNLPGMLGLKDYHRSEKRTWVAPAEASGWLMALPSPQLEAAPVLVDLMHRDGDVCRAITYARSFYGSSVTSYVQPQASPEQDAAVTTVATGISGVPPAVLDALAAGTVPSWARTVALRGEAWCSLPLETLQASQLSATDLVAPLRLVFYEIVLGGWCGLPAVAEFVRIGDNVRMVARERWSVIASHFSQTFFAPLTAAGIPHAALDGPLLALVRAPRISFDLSAAFFEYFIAVATSQGTRQVPPTTDEPQVLSGYYFTTLVRVIAVLGSRVGLSMDELARIATAMVAARSSSSRAASYLAALEAEEGLTPGADRPALRAVSIFAWLQLVYKYVKALARLIGLPTASFPRPSSVLSTLAFYAALAAEGFDAAEAMECPELRDVFQTALTGLAQPTLDYYAESVEAAATAAAAAASEAAARAAAAPPSVDELAQLKAMGEGLPVSAHRDHIVQLIDSQQIVCIEGETGCGKSTMVPQFILDAHPEARIIVTQPRRLAAVSLARHVANMRGSRLGAEVGYRIGGEHAAARGRTALTFVTTGYLLALLVHHPDALADYTHVVLDEVHERDLDMDLLTLVLKLHLRQYGVKLILMSATMDVKVFVDYFMRPIETTNAETGATERVVVADARPPKVFVGVHRFPSRVVYLDTICDLADVERAIVVHEDGDGDAVAPASAPDFDPHDAFFEVEVDEATRASLFQGLKTFCKSFGATLPDKAAFATLAQPGPAAAPAYVSHARVPPLLAKPEVLVPLLRAGVGVVEALAEPGAAVLIFLPGLGAITELYDMFEQNANVYSALTHSGTVGRESKPLLNLVVLHSSIPRAEQEAAFNAPPLDATNVVLATNIAESSITVPGLTAVLDYGLEKVVQYDPKSNMTCLLRSWAAKSSAKQRSGRAGRLSPGTVVRMYPKFFFEDYMPEYGKPDIERMPLERLVLRIRQLGLGSVKDVLAKIITPPAESRVVRALEELDAWGAMRSRAEDAEITILGHMAMALPVDLKYARLVFLGVTFGLPVDGIIMAAALTIQDVFSLPSPFFLKSLAEFRARMHESLLDRAKYDAGAYSEPIAVLRLFRSWLAKRAKARPGTERSALARFCRARAVSWKRISQLENLVKEIATKVMTFLPAQGSVRAAVYSLSKLRVHNSAAGRVAPDPRLKALLAAAFPLNYLRGSKTPKNVKIAPAVLARGLPPERTVIWNSLPEASESYLKSALVAEGDGPPLDFTLHRGSGWYAMVFPEPPAPLTPPADQLDARPKLALEVQLMLQLANGRGRMKLPSKASVVGMVLGKAKTVDVQPPMSPWQLTWAPMGGFSDAGKVYPYFRSPLAGYALVDTSTKTARAVAATIQGTNSADIFRATGCTLLEPLPLYDGILLTTISRGWELQAVVGGLASDTIVGVVYWLDSTTAGSGKVCKVAFAKPLGLAALSAINTLRAMLSSAFDSSGGIVDLPKPAELTAALEALELPANAPLDVVLDQSLVELQSNVAADLTVANAPRAATDGPILAQFASLSSTLQPACAADGGNASDGDPARVAWLVDRVEETLKRMGKPLDSATPASITKTMLEVIKSRLVLNDHKIAGVLRPALCDRLQRAGSASMADFLTVHAKTINDRMDAYFAALADQKAAMTAARALAATPDADRARAQHLLAAMAADIYDDYYSDDDDVYGRGN
ncbi:uncharacterized protein AMSG_02901 [Thecamonas trahens ATCC 50062]|uniref:Uncharacterized protein n=1 Tax=Thecamonas trahens ATCC 50062 TaxID=461836 RepID=A0A0L0D272_THETB|nr:hypothetical protein AMSG_02901 [Thecamonas trahens ATCC 50062]KNC46444.1 hypothetical protein AMSG_02901 [Thecamonas trahens ATCC 50062]|eukprot:XP_013760735.1 hypothetical protein AMSG_02901 [Thecamonas trahens ATCC 50062]